MVVEYVDHEENNRKKTNREYLLFCSRISIAYFNLFGGVSAYFFFIQLIRYHALSNVDRVF